MKLVDLLKANLTAEQWPEKYPHATQDLDGEVYFCDTASLLNDSGVWFTRDEIGTFCFIAGYDLFELASDHRTAIVHKSEVFK